MSQRRQPYIRAKNPHPIRLTKRDQRILETIYAFDGMMSLKQIDRLFFSGEGRSQPRARMRALFDNGYLDMPTPRTIHQIPLGETIYWLGKKGAEVVAALHGEILTTFTWRSKPRFSLVNHDLAVNDFRLTTHEAIASQNKLKLGQWLPEGEFLAHPDVITFTQVNGKSRKRQMRPDGFFTIEHLGKPDPFAFLLEIDMSTEDNPRFAREKVKPGVTYLKSAAYQQRFGLRYGRFLVVTTGERRMHNLKTKTEQTGGNGLFYFTTFEAVTAKTILKKPIWWLAGENTPRCIIPS